MSSGDSMVASRSLAIRAMAHVSSLMRIEPVGSAAPPPRTSHPAHIVALDSYQDRDPSVSTQLRIAELPHFDHIRRDACIDQGTSNVVHPFLTSAIDANSVRGMLIDQVRDFTRFVPIGVTDRIAVSNKRVLSINTPSVDGQHESLCSRRAATLWIRQPDPRD